MDDPLERQKIEIAAFRLRNASRAIAFTGAGISAASGIPVFRGADGLWSRYDISCLELNYFYRHPREAWMVIKEMFYDHFEKAQPNSAHRVLAQLEAEGLLAGVITQNIDHLHQLAGSRHVVEFHGSKQFLVCPGCGERFEATSELLSAIPPCCSRCQVILKPDFVFFGEGVPPAAYQAARHESYLANVWLIIGTTGEVMPACSFPADARRNGAYIIEINPRPSQFTETITDLFLCGKAEEVLQSLYDVLHGPLFAK